MIRHNQEARPLVQHKQKLDEDLKAWGQSLNSARNELVPWREIEPLIDQEEKRFNDTIQRFLPLTEPIDITEVENEQFRDDIKNKYLWFNRHVLRLRTAILMLEIRLWLQRWLWILVSIPILAALIYLVYKLLGQWSAGPTLP